MCIQEEKFTQFVKDIESFKSTVLGKIDDIPNQVLSTPIEVKNGSVHSISVKEAIVQNWEKTSKIEAGYLNIQIEDADGYPQTWKLNDIIDKLVNRPSNTISKMAKYSDWFYKIIKLAEAVGVIWVLSYLLGGSK